MRMEDNAYRLLAAAYLKEYSAELRRELEATEALASMPTPNLDHRVHARIAAIRRTRRTKLLGGLAAACLVFSLAIPTLWQMRQQAALSSPATYEMLPMSFVLPTQFTISSVAQDYNMTVYTLDDRMNDPVVMTMESNGDISFFDTLTPLTIAGQQVYGRSEPGYSLLAFTKRGILYVLTCEYDFNTLANLSREILV